MFRRIWDWIVQQIVQPDPWEPRLAPGQFLLRERLNDDQLLPGRVLGVVDSPEEMVEFVAAHRLSRYFVTTNHFGHYETADNYSAWRLIRLYRFEEPEMSPAEVQEILLRRAG
jgi:hypothetical protein